MTVSRRQFLRACMYAAPAALVAPKAVSYFLPPPKVETFAWEDGFKRYSGFEYIEAGTDGVHEIMTRTLRKRAGALADNVTKNNALLKRLMDRQYRDLSREPAPEMMLGNAEQLRYLGIPIEFDRDPRGGLYMVNTANPRIERLL